MILPESQKRMDKKPLKKLSGRAKKLKTLHEGICTLRVEEASLNEALKQTRRKLKTAMEEYEKELERAR